MANVASTQLVNASSQFWSITNAAQTGLNFTTAFTLAAWINVNALSATYPFIAKVDGGASALQYNFYTNGDKKLTLDISDNGGQGAGHFGRFVTTATQINSTATWIHIAVTFSTSAGTPTVIFYVNGSSVASSETIGTTVGSLFSGTQAFEVGYDNGYSGTHFDGLMDDVRVYNAVLTSGQISSLFSTPCTFSDPGSLQGKWLFENNGNDSSANANNLTNNNSATFSSNVPYVCGGGVVSNAAFLLKMI